jgi:phosphatidylserine/phosphatidylglycerophosphate/cardiolipin synthase-like enzyme
MDAGRSKSANLMTRRSTTWLLSVSLALTGCAAAGVADRAPSAQGPVCAVYFSPRGGCTERVVEALRQARRQVLVQAYSFTSQPIAQALIEAARRGVSVDVILDKSQRTERHTEADELVGAGVPVEVDAAHAIAHNKVMVIDGETVITGSFNFTTSAEERNAENLLVIRDRALAAQYASNWRTHRTHARPFGAGSP